jgi:hypothetical protein
MKASELRIGNLIKGIYHDYDDGIDEEIENETICKVVTLDVSGSGDYPIYVYSDENIEHFSDFKPIQLTEEWLFKFGFQKSMSWTYVVELKGNLKLVYYLGEKGWSIGFKSYSDFSNLEYVHQLQNLYFALTGEELKQQEQ